MSTERMNPLKEGRHDPTLWLLAFVPVVFAAAKVKPEAHTLLFVLSVLAIMPLAALLSHATESVAAKTGDAAGGLLNATSAFSGARKNRLDLSVGIWLGSASQIALFVAPMLLLLSYVIGPTPMDLQLWPGAVVMVLIATLTASLVTNSGRSTWFVGVLVLMVYLIFAMTLYLLPPRVQ
jgi:Ca2+/H+ antiporter